MSGNRIFLFSPLTLMVCGLLACGVVKNPTPVENLSDAVSADAPAPEYVIRNGDQLEIKFFYNPELNETVKVRPDGRISLQLIPEVQANNLTVNDLSMLLKEHYSGDLSDPELTVIVRGFASHRVYVGGEVGEPREIPLVGRLTVLQAIAMAGSFTDRSRLAEVILIRRNVDLTALVVPLNMKTVIDGTDFSQDIALMPYDVIFVPRSVIANVNKWVEQYIRNNIPVDFGFRIELSPR